MTEEEEDSIWGDIFEDTPVEITQPSERSRLAWDAWSLWAKITQRDDKAMPDRKFVDAYRDLLTRYDNDQLMECVRAAAHLLPHSRDSRDVRRVINALTRHNTEALAIKLMQEGRPIYHYGWRPPPSAFKSSVADIENSCGIDNIFWTERDQEAAGMMLEAMEPERLDELAASAKLTLRVQNVLPADMLRFIHTKNVRGVADPNRGTYQSGRKEQNTLEGLHLEADYAAERLLMDGVSAAQVRKFHLLAPEGYWEEVMSLMEEDIKRSWSQIYQDLESKWNWNPSERQKP